MTDLACPTDARGPGDARSITLTDIQAAEISRKSDAAASLAVNSGTWVELVDAAGATVYTRAVYQLIPLSQEAFAPEGPSQVPDDWKDKVLHARMELGETSIMAADVPPERFQPMRSAYLTLMLDTVDDAERIYALLIDGGEIFMKMEETFFAKRFGMVADRFGVGWMVIVEQ